MKPEEHPSDAAELRVRAEAAFLKKTAQSPENLEALTPEATRQLLHELRVHQIELEMQNEELRRAHLELDVSHARYFDLYDLAPVGYVTLNEAGLILQANFAAATLLGVKRGDLVKQPLSRFILQEDADSYYLLRRQISMTGVARDCDLRLVKSDSTIFWAHLAATVAPDESGAPILRLTLSSIEEREEYKKELQEKEERLSLATLHNGIGIWDWNLITQQLVWDDSMFALYHIRREDFSGTEEAWRAALHPEDLERGVQELTDALAGKMPFDTEFRVVWPNGEVRHIKAAAKIFRDEQGTPLRMLGTNWDITASKLAEQALATTTELLERTGKLAKVGGWSLDLVTMEHHWSLATCHILEVDPPVAPPLEQGINFFAPEARPVIQSAVQAAIEHGTPYDLELPVITAKGRPIWVRAQCHAVMADGKATKLVGALHDITERKLAEQLLAWENDALGLIISEASLQEVLSGLMIGLENQLPGALCSILLLDDDGIHLRHGAAPSLSESYNRAIDGGAIGPAAGSCGTAAHTKRQIIVSNIASDPLWTAYRELALSHGLLACWSTPILGRDQSILGTYAIYYREPRHPTSVELEVITRVVKITRIAIERKQSEAALRDSEEKFHALFENASDAILINQGELFIECNARTLEMFGCQSRDQILGHPPYEFSPRLQPNGRDSTEFAIEKINATYNGQPQFFEWTHTKLDGTPFPTEVNLIKIDVGGTAFIQAIIRDISERKRAEEMIRQQNAELESRVEQRTAALSKANNQLRGHMTTRRELEKEILEISEREQKRIGQDLHDDLGQQLAGIWCLSQLLESSLVKQKSPEAPAATKITSRLQESLELTRKLAQGLYPVALQADGLSSALDELARRTTEIFKVTCRSKCPQKLNLDYTVATHLYRIAQEAITNATKHGHAQNIEIELSSNSRHTYLTVNNDGIPMAKKMINGDGMGLRIMKYRADMIDGKLSIKPNKDSNGTSVTCMIQTPKE